MYNYNKDTTQGAGYFRQIGENAKTTIEGSFYNAGFKSGSGGRQDALVHINGGTFTVKGNFENGKNIPNVYDDYYGVGNLLAMNGAVITVEGNFTSNAQGESLSLADTDYRFGSHGKPLPKDSTRSSKKPGGADERMLGEESFTAYIIYGSGEEIPEWYDFLLGL